MTTASQHFADRLGAAVAARGAGLCVGLDPVAARLPEALRGGDPVGGIDAFCRGVIEAVSPIAAAVKFQSACFERYLGPGVTCLHELMRVAKDAGLIVILDAKRGDIGVSSEHYAAATIGCDWVDAVTINPYMGEDAMGPFLEASRDGHKGLFVLVRTSNPGSASVQELRAAGSATVAEAVAALVSRIGDGPGMIGACGYSAVGAVVGATRRAQLASLRRLMPRQVLLLPGFGAQGAGVSDVREAFTSGGGALVTASRSIIYAYEAGERAGAGAWRSRVAEAAAQTRQALEGL